MNKGIWISVAVVVIAVVVFGLTMNKKEETATMAPVTPAAVEPTANAWPSQQKAFLDANGKKPGWTTTASGLQYQVLKAGDPAAPKPAPGSEVTVHYEGKLIDGSVFDSSIARNEPATFPLNGVIQGWGEGVPLMRVGDTYEFAIPANLAYGQRAVSTIPAGSTLIFKIELLKAMTPAP